MITSGYENISVELLNAELSIGRLFWSAYRMTWRDLQSKEYDATDSQVQEACWKIAKNQALPTCKESVTLLFQINNISRVCLAQITRGRLGWWFNVESQMPQRVKHEVICPLNIYENEKFCERVKQLQCDSEKLYEDACDAGVPPQDARYLLLHGQTCSLVTSCNLPAFLGFCSLRMENGLADEINLVARFMRSSIFNRVFDDRRDNQLDSLSFDLWLYFINQMDCAGASKQVCLNYDDVFGNTGRFPSGSPDVPAAPKFDFKRSAWFLELQSLPDELLLPGEKQMLERLS